MVTDLASMPATQQLVLKLQSIAAILTFGAIAGLVLRRVFRALKGDAFIQKRTSRDSPFGPA